MTGTQMHLDIYADVLCPWCYIGHRRLQTALAGRLDGTRMDVRWRSFELAPNLSRAPGPTAAEQMAAASWWGDAASTRIAEIRALGAAEGLELNLHLARPVNSFDAHRLAKLAAACGRAGGVMELLLHGYHTEGLNIADRSVLERIGVRAGLAGDDIRTTLTGDAFEADVRTDERLARSRGVTGVPSLVVDDRPAVNGVLSAAALQQLVDDAVHPVES